MTKTVFTHDSFITPEIANAWQNPTYSATPENDGELPYPSLEGLGVPAAIGDYAAAENPVVESIANFSSSTWGSALNEPFSFFRISKARHHILFDFSLSLTADSSSPPSTPASVILEPFGALSAFPAFALLRGALPTSHSAGTLWLHGQLASGASGYNGGALLVPLNTRDIVLRLSRSGTDLDPSVTAELVVLYKGVVNWSDVFADAPTKQFRHIAFKGAILGSQVG